MTEETDTRTAEEMIRDWELLGKELEAERAAEPKDKPIFVDGEKYMARDAGDSVLFEKDGKVWGIVKDKIKMLKPARRGEWIEFGRKDGLIVAWEAGGEIKSVELGLPPDSYYLGSECIAIVSMLGLAAKPRSPPPASS